MITIADASDRASESESSTEQSAQLNQHYTQPQYNYLMTIKIEISNDKGETVANTPNRLNCRDKKVTRCVLDTNGYKKEYNKTLAAVSAAAAW